MAKPCPQLFDRHQVTVAEICRRLHLRQARLRDMPEHQRAAGHADLVIPAAAAIRIETPEPITLAAERAIGNPHAHRDGRRNAALLVHRGDALPLPDACRHAYCSLFITLPLAPVMEFATPAAR